MDFLKGLKTILGDSDIRKEVIKSTVIATAATGVAAYAVTRAATKKWRKENEEYLNEPETVTVDGELYKRLPNGNLVPFSRYMKNRGKKKNYKNPYTKRQRTPQYRPLPEPPVDVDIIYIKGRPFTMDEHGNYVPVRMPINTRRNNKY